MKKFTEKIEEIKQKWAGQVEAKRVEDSKTGHKTWHVVKKHDKNTVR